jgi:hypothetical protein
MNAPCLSVGQYDRKVGKDFANMLLAKKVDLVLTGQDHVYQRTHQLGTGPAYGTLDVTLTVDQFTARFVSAKDYIFTDAFTIGR